MEKEFETQVLDINVEEIKSKLRKLGAVEEPEVLQRRWVFDMDKCTVDSQGKWIRLRQSGDKKPTLTFKNKTGAGLAETTEIEVAVDDFDKMAKIISRIDGFIGKYYQENKRLRFEYRNIEFTLDTWPMIPTFLEVEAKTEGKVSEGLKLLGLSGKEVGHIGTVAIYHRHDIELHDLKELRF